MFACTGAGITATGIAAPPEPAWLAGLAEQLRGISQWVRTETLPGGGVAVHCGMSDAAAWAGGFSKITGPKQRVRAGGNVLAFSLHGQEVRVTMHSAA